VRKNSKRWGKVAKEFFSNLKDSLKIQGIYLGIFPRLDSKGFHLMCFCGENFWKNKQTSLPIK
jgi:hypothetical protein